MPNLPTVTTSGPPLMQAVQSRVTARDITALADAEADTAKTLQATAEEVATPIAEREGTLAGMRSVTRDADGNVVVQNQPHPFIVGKLADVYDASAKAAYAANLTDEAHTYMQQLAAKTMLPADQGGGGGDPAWFKAQMDAWTMQVAKNQRGGMQTATLAAGRQIGEQYYRNVLAQKTALDGEAAKQALTAEVSRLDDQNVALARQNYGGPEFSQSYQQYADTWRKLAADPRTGVSAAMAAAKIDEAGSRYQANAIIGDVERAYDPKRGGSWEAAAKKAEQIMTSPDLRLDEHERRNYYNLALGQIRLMEGERKAQASALAGEGARLATDIGNGLPIDSGTIDDFMSRARQVGAVDVMDRIMRAEAQAKMVGQFRGLPTAALMGLANGGRLPGSSSAVGAAPPAGQPYTGPAQMTAQQVKDLAQREVETQGLVGVVPIDGPKFGITTGSAAEWAAFMARISNAESSHNNGDTFTESFTHGGKNVVSRGLYSLSEHDAATYGLNGGQYFTPQQLADPNVNTAAAVSIIKRLVAGGGTIQGSLGRYWSTVRDGTVLRVGEGGGDGGAGAPAGAVSGAPVSSAVGWRALPPASVVRVLAKQDATAAAQARTDAVFAGQAPVTTDAFATSMLGKVMKERVGYQLPEMLKAMDQFEIPAKEDVDALAQITALVGTPEQQQKAAELGVRAEFGAAARSMTTAQFEAAVSAKSEEYREKGSAAERDAVAWARKLPGEIQSRFQSDPWGAASWMGIPTQSTKQPLDLSNPQNFAAGLRARAADAGLIQANRGLPAFSAFTPAELPAAKQIVQQGTPDQVAGFFGALNALPEDMRRATMQKLSEGGDVDPQLLAGDLFGKNPAVARSILAGLSQIKDPTFKEKGNTFDQTFIDVFPPKDFAVDASSGSAPRTWVMVRDAAMARVKDMNFQKGRIGLETTAEDVKQAINDVTGGVVSWNGASIIAPRYGMGPAAFARVMSSLTADDLRGSVSAEPAAPARLPVANMGGASGAPRELGPGPANIDQSAAAVPAEGLSSAVTMSGRPLMAADLTAWNSPYKLQSVGDGRYLIFTEAGGVRRYVQRGGSAHLAHEGGPFLLDLTGAAKRVLSGG